MKLRWVWILAITVLCLLWSLNPAASFDKHLVAWSRGSCSASSYPSLPVSEDSIRSREGPKLFLTPDALLRTEDLGPEGPPWLESRGPPGKCRASQRPAGLLVANVATAALRRGKTTPKYLFPAKFSGHRPLQIKIQGFATAFS